MADSDLKMAAAIAVGGLRVQNPRMRIIAENVANAKSTASTPGVTHINARSRGSPRRD